MYSNNSGGKLERFLEGKGFYIVLFLCAAVIGMSVWAMNAGAETVYEELEPVNEIDSEVIETILINEPEEYVPIVDEEETEEVFAESELTNELYPEGATAAEAAAIYLWPVSGSVERGFMQQALAYDTTMDDWRTHCAVDIEAENGQSVAACHSGTVESVYNDSLLGTVMVINHGDGLKSVYANLENGTTAEAGTWVSAGSAVAKVGSSAIGESGQKPHLHFAMFKDGYAVDPMSYLSD